jgi:hypothetical protein
LTGRLGKPLFIVRGSEFSGEKFMKNNIKVFAAIVTGLVGGLFSSAVLAQNEAASDESIFEEVIVTATKRAESIYDVPMAVSAFTEEATASSCPT